MIFLRHYHIIFWSDGQLQQILM